MQQCANAHDAYAAFLARKAIIDPPTGIAEPPALPAQLFEFQRDITRWALKRGRSAIFAGTGLGKSFMELSWGDAIHRETQGDILHFAPLAVAAQMVREAEKFGIPARHVRSQDECGPGINITNYQKLAHFDVSKFAGVTLDESSILKSETGHYRTELIQACADVPYRLAATATPAPNDFMELGNHAEFLGIMSYTDMLSTFFTHDGGETQKWRLKGHAENDFWRWVASWAVLIRKPSDLGYENGGYDLPPLEQVHHVVKAGGSSDLFGANQATTLQERIKARRESVSERVALAVEIAMKELVWNKTSQSSESLTCGRTTAPTKTNGKKRESKKTSSTIEFAKSENQTLNLQNISGLVDGRETLRCADGESSTNLLASAKTIMSECSPLNQVDAPSAVQKSFQRTEEVGSVSTTATKPGKSEVCSVDHATGPLGNLEMIKEGSREHSLTCKAHRPDSLVIWCQLNIEQTMIEKALGSMAISIHGGHDEDEKLRRHDAWLSGDAPILIAKPSMFGHGLNWQHCNKCIFVGLNDSFEQVYQAIRRFWRFGQQKPVTAHFIAAETEGAVVANLKRKEDDAERMAAAMVLHTANINKENIGAQVRDKADYNPTEEMRLPAWLS